MKNKMFCLFLGCKGQSPEQQDLRNENSLVDMKKNQSTTCTYCSVGSQDSFPTPVEMDTPSHLNNLSTLSSFIPDNMLEELEQLNLSKDSILVNVHDKNLPAEKGQGDQDGSSLISEDETILYENPADRYSELMISTVAKSQSVDSGFTSDSKFHAVSRAMNEGQSSVNKSISTLASDVSWLGGPITSSVIGHRSAVLPNISLTSISSQVR